MASVDELIAAANAEKSPFVSGLEGLARGYLNNQNSAIERAKTLIMLEQNKREQEQQMETQRRLRAQYEKQIEEARKQDLKNIGEKKSDVFPNQKLKTVWEEDEKGMLTQKQTLNEDEKKPTMIFAVDQTGQAIDPFSGEKLPEQNPDLNYRSVTIPRQGNARYNPAQQSSYMDSSDNTPVFWDVATKSYLRVTDKKKPIGKIAPVKGNADAVTSASRGVSLLKNVDAFFDKLDEGGEISQRMKLAPGVRQVFHPEIERFVNELKQVGFSFGGKQLTGTEEDIIMGTFVPNALDNKESKLAKRQALKSYLSGNIDLLAASNLLGTQGQAIRDVLKPYMEGQNLGQQELQPKNDDQNIEKFRAIYDY